MTITNMQFTKPIPAVTMTLILGMTTGLAQTTKMPLTVSAIKPLPSLESAMAASGKANSLARVVQAYDSQLIDRINATRKFEVVGRSDLKDILREQELAASGNVAVDDPNAANAGELAGAKYLLVATIDDFEDTTERIVLTNLNRSGLKRKIRLSTTAKIYDSTTGRLIESTNVRLEAKDDRMDDIGINRDSELTDVLLLDVTRKASENIATQLADIVFPIRVLTKRNNQISINRGDGAGVEPGQVFDVYVQGELLVDPDTNEVLGREEVRVGKARIISVQPKFSTAEIIEDFGVDRGAVLRPAM